MQRPAHKLAIQRMVRTFHCQARPIQSTWRWSATSDQQDGSPPHITLASRIRIAILPTTRSCADASATATAITASGLGGFRLRRQSQRTAGTAANLGAAAALGAADGTVIADEQLTLAMRHTALAARAWVVGSVNVKTAADQQQ